MPIAELQKIDWTNAVAVPLFLSLTIGVLLSVWTGLIAGRYTEAKAAIREAEILLTDIDYVTLPTTDEIKRAENRAIIVRMRINAALKAAGQIPVIDRIREIIEAHGPAVELFGNALKSKNATPATKAEAAEEFMRAIERRQREITRIRIDYFALAAPVLVAHLRRVGVRNPWGVAKKRERENTGKGLTIV